MEKIQNNNSDWDSFFINPQVYKFLTDSIANFEKQEKRMILMTSNEGMGKRFYIRKLEENYRDKYTSYFFKFNLLRIAEPFYPFLIIIRKRFPRKEDFFLFLKKENLNINSFNFLLEKLYNDNNLFFFEYEKVDIRRKFLLSLIFDVLNKIAEQEPFIIYISNFQRMSRSSLEFFKYFLTTKKIPNFFIIATSNENLIDKEKQYCLDNIRLKLSTFKKSPKSSYIKLSDFEIEMFSKFYQHFGLETNEILELFSTTGSNIYFSKNLYYSLQKRENSILTLGSIILDRLENIPEAIVQKAYLYYLLGIFDFILNNIKIEGLLDDYNAFKEEYYQATNFNYETDISNSVFVRVLISFLNPDLKKEVHKKVLEYSSKLDKWHNVYIRIYIQLLLLKDKNRELLPTIEEDCFYAMRQSFVFYSFETSNKILNIINTIKESYKRSFKGTNNLILLQMNGDMLFFLKQYNDAMNVYRQILELIKRKDYQMRLPALFMTAKIYEAREEYRQMLDWYQKIQLYAREMFVPFYEALSYYQIGILANRIGTIFSKGPEFYFEEAIKIINDYHLTDNNFIYEVYAEYTTSLFLIWKYDEAQVFMKKLKKLSNQDLDPFLYVKLDKIQADYYSSIGRWKDATKYYLSAIEHNERLLDNQNITYLYNAVGYCNYSGYNFRKGLEYYFKAFLYMSDAIDESEIGLSFDNIGELLYMSGLYDKAIEYYEKALFFKDLSSRWIKITGFFSEIKTEINLGICYIKNGDINKAEELYDKVKDEKGEAIIIHHKTKMQLLKALISIYYKQYIDAEKEFKEIIDFFGPPEELFVIQKKHLYDIYKEIENFYEIWGQEDKLKETRDKIAELEKKIEINHNEKNRSQQTLLKILKQYERKINFDSFVKKIEEESEKKLLRYKTNDFDFLNHLSIELIRQIDLRQIYQILVDLVQDYFPWSGVCLIHKEELKEPDILAYSNLTKDFFDDNFFKTIITHYFPVKEITVADNLELLRDNSKFVANPFLTAMFIPVKSINDRINTLIIFQFNDDAQFGVANNSFLQLIANIAYISMQSSYLFKKTQELAIYDNLTVLNTKYFFDIKLDEIIELSTRYGYKFAIMYIDIDNFSQFNTTYGFSVGDLILKYMGDIIHETFRINDVSARIETDLFGIIVPYANEEILQNLFKRINTKMKENPFLFKNAEGFEKTLPITISAGSALFPQHGKTKDKLMGMLLSSLEEAVEKGNCIVVKYVI